LTVVFSYTLGDKVRRQYMPLTKKGERYCRLHTRRLSLNLWYADKGRAPKIVLSTYIAEELLQGTPRQTTEQYTSPKEMQLYYFKEKHPLEDSIFSPQGYI